MLKIRYFSYTRPLYAIKTNIDKTMEVITNKIILSNLNKFSKMSLYDFENNEIKHRIELLDNNYEYLKAIKSGELSKYTNEEDLIKIKKLSEYFFGNISLPLQKKMIKEYEQTVLHQTSEKTPLTSQQEEFLSNLFPLEYVRYLNARIYVYLIS